MIRKLIGLNAQNRTSNTLPFASETIAIHTILLDIQAILLLVNAASDTLLVDNRETIASRTFLLCFVVITAIRAFLPERKPILTHKHEYIVSWKLVVQLCLLKSYNLFVIIVCCLAVKYSDFYLVLLPVVGYPLLFLLQNFPSSMLIKWYHGYEWILVFSIYLLLACIKYFLINNSTIALTVYTLNLNVQLVILYPLYFLLDMSSMRGFMTLRDVYFFLHCEREKFKVLYGWEDMSFQEAMLRVCRKGTLLYEDCQQFCVDHQIVVVAEMDRPSEKAPLI
jgi:hypothetical protein